MGNGDDCKNCVYVINLKETIGSEKLRLNDIVSRVTKLESANAVNTNKLDTIQTGIENINKKLDELDERPNKLLYSILGTVLGAVITMLVMQGIKNFGG